MVGHKKKPEPETGSGLGSVWPHLAQLLPPALGLDGEAPQHEEQPAGAASRAHSGARPTASEQGLQGKHMAGAEEAFSSWRL